MPSTELLIHGSTPTLRARLYAKIVGRESPRKCWRWTGKTCRKRAGVRGAIRVGGVGSRIISVTRILLCLRDGVPLERRHAAKLEAGHTCHNFWCVNPRHLEWVTREQNEQAKYERSAIRARRIRKAEAAVVEAREFDRFMASIAALEETA